MRSLPYVFTSDGARRAGYSESQIRRRVTNREWLPVRRGVYLTRRTDARIRDDPQLGHLLSTAAAMLVTRGPSWASHSTARRMHRLPTLNDDPAAVELTVEPVRGRKLSRRHDGIEIRPAAVPETHRTRHRDVPVLSVPRTVVDTARCHDLAAGLITADAALHLQRTDRAALRAVLDDCAGWPGIVGARRVVRHADGKRESPLESRSFAFFVEHEMPLPECQVELFDLEGNLLGRVDFYWRRFRLVGEADGKVKYVEQLVDGPAPSDRLWLERLRHDVLDDAGESVVRWTHHDITRRPRATRDRIYRAMERAYRRLHGRPAS